jgi:hypothetical protein
MSVDARVLGLLVVGLVIVGANDMLAYVGFAVGISGIVVAWCGDSKPNTSLTIISKYVLRLSSNRASVTFEQLISWQPVVRILFTPSMKE